MTVCCSGYTLTNGIANELSLAEGATSANFGALDLLLTVLDAILYLASSSSCSQHTNNQHTQISDVAHNVMLYTLRLCLQYLCYLSLLLLLLFVPLSFE
jgi:hypothetical protein